VIENGIARCDIAQKIDKRNLIGLRTGKRAHNEVEIGGGKPRPTIRPDHRDFIMRDCRTYGKSDCCSDPGSLAGLAVMLASALASLMEVAS
jgi:hypothetical protein